ncbi:unnamed protein product [Effrenium voratum]|nr:unnamed protein product [Effrenium voratum]
MWQTYQTIRKTVALFKSMPCVSGCVPGGPGDLVALEWSLCTRMQREVEPNHFCESSAVSSLCWPKALHVLQVPKKVACGALVAACAKASAWEAALGCLQRMQEAQITPGAVEVGTVAAALGQARGREQAWQLMRSMAELWRTHGEAPPVNLEGILKQGKGILVANKPEGISTERFAARLSARLGHRPLSLISRLDFPTSGVLPLALGTEASFGARWFQAQLAARLVAKEYLCLCEGLPMGCVGTRGRVSAPLRTLLLDSVATGREACTEYEAPTDCMEISPSVAPGAAALQRARVQGE